MKNKSKLDKIRRYYKIMNEYYLYTYKYWKICVDRSIPIVGDKSG